MPKPKTIKILDMEFTLERNDRPRYANGAEMPLWMARWHGQHDVVAIVPANQESRAKGNIAQLIASNGDTLDIWCMWGLELCSEKTEDGFAIVVRPRRPIYITGRQIAAWEAEFPDEPKVGQKRAA